MSGHNKWSGIKHRKGAQDAKRANAFTKIARLISIAVREGGGKPEMNYKLQMAIDQARALNMPKDNIERAIKNGTGELKEGGEFTEVLYEAYGPGNVAMLIKCATDNKNRTVSEVKSLLTKAGGKMAAEGAVAFQFMKVGEIGLALAGREHEQAELDAIEAGAEDVLLAEETLVVYTKPENLHSVRETLEKAGYRVEGADLTYLPLQKSELAQDERIDYEKLLEKLDEQDDVQEVYDNL